MWTPPKPVIREAVRSVDTSENARRTVLSYLSCPVLSRTTLPFPVLPFPSLPYTSMSCLAPPCPVPSVHVTDKTSRLPEVNHSTPDWQRSLHPPLTLSRPDHSTAHPFANGPNDRTPRESAILRGVAVRPALQTSDGRNVASSGDFPARRPWKSPGSSLSELTAEFLSGLAARRQDTCAEKVRQLGGDRCSKSCFNRKSIAPRNSADLGTRKWTDLQQIQPD